MSGMDEALAKYIDSPVRVDLSVAEQQAATYVQVAALLGRIDDEVDHTLRRELHDGLIKALSGSVFALVSAEYVFPLAMPHVIPRNPYVATGRTMVIDTSAHLQVLPMPFKPDMLDSQTEWTGVGVVAHLADAIDLCGDLKKIHDELNLAPAVAIPLHNNIIEMTRILEAA